LDGGPLRVQHPVTLSPENPGQCSQAFLHNHHYSIFTKCTTGSENWAGQ